MMCVMEPNDTCHNNNQRNNIHHNENSHNETQYNRIHHNNYNQNDIIIQ
jgi:hypothetical protein